MLQHKNKTIAASVIFVFFLVLVVYFAWPQNHTKGSAKTDQAPQSHVADAQPNSEQYPTDTANSLWAVVNKGRVMPSTYAPANLVIPNVPLRLNAASSEMHLRPETALAIEQMVSAAKTQGIQLMLVSGYRSYTTQVSVYQNYVNTQGQAAADTFSARPGHSEHQTGLAADVGAANRKCELDQCFDATPEGQWLTASAYQYGFIIRYPKNSQNLTGYQYEPWHIRYVGKQLASQLHSSGQILEQYFGLPIYTTYPDSMTTLKID